ncbi:MAG: hypothetical protein HON98_04425 [Chloroflexi bacterium]|jgi:hypothetical protein|nr:hypothetical protein [Chloroflexota bacterium]MBT3671216.1 hypothetical protein [Chloroflexota bacterium]MBT4003536.1 hypothetical protein [Chloroflexota bacterium]MBT4304325.1 hypothetical protein [Chloroflexota bacterium]MBT4534344.1 hypothetical protein [Chloroflexota bacterium]
MRKNKLFLFLTILIITALACSATSGDNDANNAGNDTGNKNENSDSQADEDQNEPSGQNLPTGPNEISLENQDLYLDYFDKNYLMDFSYTFSGEDSTGADVSGSFEMSGKYAVDPVQGADFEMTMEGLAGAEEVGYIHFVDTPTRDYVYIPASGCISFGNNEFSSPFDSFSDTEGMFVGTAELEEKGVRVSGILADRYKLTQENISNTGLEIGETFELEEGLIWVAREGYMIKLVMEGKGNSLAITDNLDLLGDIKYDILFIPSDDPIIISPPAECDVDEAGQPGSKFPITEDATNISNIADQIVTYTTAMSQSDLQEFVKNEMENQGYSITTQSISGSTVSIQFVNGSSTINFIAFPDGTGKISVNFSSF